MSALTYRHSANLGRSNAHLLPFWEIALMVALVSGPVRAGYFDDLEYAFNNTVRPVVDTVINQADEVSAHFLFLGTDLDVVGQQSTLPGGGRDGHFRLTMFFPAITNIRSIRVEGGSGVWSTENPQAGFIGVLDVTPSLVKGLKTLDSFSDNRLALRQFAVGPAVNYRGYQNNFGDFSGVVILDLFLNDTVRAEISEGTEMTVTVIRGDGKELVRRQAKLTDANASKKGCYCADMWVNVACARKITPYVPKTGSSARNALLKDRATTAMYTWKSNIINSCDQQCGGANWCTLPEGEYHCNPKMFLPAKKDVIDAVSKRCR